ncbi:MAG: serine/threonine-protein kinase [Candidatus Krumholzibacteriota bacterium]
MESARFSRLRRIVDEALTLPTAERETYVRKECRDDAGLMTKALDLLAHERTADSRITGVLKDQVRSAAASAVGRDDGPVSIGDYRIVAKLGEGGMGVVYQAEQTGALQRTVALKLILAGWNSQRVVARFESERLALARMNHPNIARVFDAGSTEDGRPWFVMELVEGRHLTEWCDHHRMGSRERLGLFLEVCRGVRHAHRKGIIHRDLKPSNILVSGAAGAPVVKIIDFGIAKALTEPEEQPTDMTIAGQQLGSPDYMSPERIGGNTDDPDIRSDIYSLGVILFELLSGRLPFDRSSPGRLAFGSAAHDGTAAEPPSLASKPPGDSKSTAEVARRRGTTPGTLRRVLRGELDWITAKALAPAREDRYDTAGELIRDIERHLAGEPVLAGRPGLAYRFGKFARRYRTALAFTTLIILALAGGFGESLRQRSAAHEARDEALAVTDFLSNMLSSVRPQEKGRDVTVRQILDESATSIGTEFNDLPLVRARLQSTVGNAYLALGETDAAISFHEEVVAIRRRELGNGDRGTMLALCDLGSAVSRAGQFERAGALYREALMGLQRDSEDEVATVCRAIMGLANALADQGRLEEAEPYYLEALEASRSRLGDHDPMTASLLGNLALLRADQGRMDEAAGILAEVLELRRESLGDDAPLTMESVINLAGVQSHLGNMDEAVAALEPLVPRARRVMGETHRITLAAMNNLAWAYSRNGQPEKAEPLTRETWEIRMRVLGEEHPETLISAFNMADLHRRLGRLDEAESLHRRTLATRLRVMGEDHPHVRISQNGLADVLEEKGLAEGAASLRAQAGGE